MQPEDVPMNIEIRNETPADIQSIEAVTTSAFLTAPHTSYTEQFIVSALRDAGQLTVSLVAQTSLGSVGGG